MLFWHHKIDLQHIWFDISGNNFVCSFVQRLFLCYLCVILCNFNFLEMFDACLLVIWLSHLLMCYFLPTLVVLMLCIYFSRVYTSLQQFRLLALSLHHKAERSVPHSGHNFVNTRWFSRFFHWQKTKWHTGSSHNRTILGYWVDDVHRRTGHGSFGGSRPNFPEF